MSFSWPSALQPISYSLFSQHHFTHLNPRWHPLNPRWPTVGRRGHGAPIRAKQNFSTAAKHSVAPFPVAPFPVPYEEWREKSRKHISNNIESGESTLALPLVDSPHRCAGAMQPVCCLPAFWSVAWFAASPRAHRPTDPTLCCAGRGHDD